MPLNVCRPHRNATSASAPGAIKRVERLPLQSEDGGSAAVRITRRDGRQDVLMVRLSPPAEGFNATLPLAQPPLAPVRTADGQYALHGHVGVLAHAEDAEVRLVVGPLGPRRHIDGRAMRTVQGAVYSGELTGYAQVCAVVLWFTGLLPMLLRARWFSARHCSTPMQRCCVRRVCV